MTSWTKNKYASLGLLGSVTLAFLGIHLFEMVDGKHHFTHFLVEGSVFLVIMLALTYVLVSQSFQRVNKRTKEAQRHAVTAKRATHAFSLVADVDALIMGCDNALDIYRHTSGRIVQSGQYSLAWIGVPENGPDRKVSIVSSAGPASGYLSGLDVSWGSGQNGAGLTGAAFRTHKTQLLNNFLNSKTYRPWMKRVSAFGFGSTIAVPIMICGDVAAVLRVYSPQRDAFQSLDRCAFELLAKHLSYTLRSVDGVSHINRTISERDKLQSQLETVLMGTITSLARTIEKRDPYTAGHQQAVSEIAVAIGQKMGLSHCRLNVLRLGALVHDIGKIGVPADILTKPSKLSPAEHSIIQEHCQAGYEILEKLDFEPIKRIVVEHHERLDGSGYPKGLTKDEIMLESRIVSVADVIDSVTRHRPYRPALGIEKARAILHDGNGQHFDPDVIEAFEALYLEGYPFASQEGGALGERAQWVPKHAS